MNSKDCAPEITMFGKTAPDLIRDPNAALDEEVPGQARDGEIL